MVNLALILQSGANSFLFSYPDYEAYRDRVHTCTGLIAWFNDQLTLTDAGGIISQRTAAAGSLLGRLGMLPPGASNAGFAGTFVVSENYFSVLGVAPLRGRTFESITRPDLAASPSVLISENYWQKRFAGDAAVLGKTIRLNGALFTIVGITPHDFVGTSIGVPDFWLPLSLEPLVHPDANPLHDRENLRLRIFGRLAPGVDMRQAQAEITLLSSRIRSLHDPNSELSRPATAERRAARHATCTTRKRNGSMLLRENTLLRSEPNVSGCNRAIVFLRLERYRTSGHLSATLPANCSSRSHQPTKWRSIFDKCCSRATERIPIRTMRSKRS